MASFVQKSFTYTNTTSVTIPSYAYDIYVTVAGAKGGNGTVWGAQINNPNFIQPGGSGKIGKFKFNTDFTTKNLTLFVGQNGGTGYTITASYSPGVYTNGGSAGFGYGSGGIGMYQNVTYNGTGQIPAGGGGGGATCITLSGTPIVVAGGGGGGDSQGVYASQGQPGGDSDYVWVSTSSVSPTNGADGLPIQRQYGSVIYTYASQSCGAGGGGAPGGAASNWPPGIPGGVVNMIGSEGGRSAYNINTLSIVSDLGLNSGSGYVILEYKEYIPDPPSITSFYASPNPQTSGTLGVPDSSTTLYWTSINSSSGSIDQNVGSVGINGSVPVNTGVQSVAGFNFPATKTYTLTVAGIEANYGKPTTYTTASVTVQVYNDNTPDNYTILSQTNLEPSTLTTIFVGPISGIDMLTAVIGGPGVQVSNNNSSWSSNIVISNNQSFWVRAVSPPFNTDPSGLTNSSSQFYVDVGTVRRFFTLTTRAPDVNETFNISNYDDKLPYPDIDTVPGTPDQYITTAPLTVDDVEIDVELKTNNSNAQVRIKPSGSATFGSWQDVRSI